MPTNRSSNDKHRPWTRRSIPARVDSTRGADDGHATMTTEDRRQ